MFERAQGVRIPDGQLNPDKGEPETVFHVTPMQPYAVEYTDENGQKHVNIAYKVGDMVYLDLNGERWAAGLRQAASYIKKAVTREASSESDAVPQQDSVDVVPQAAPAPAATSESTLNDNSGDAPAPAPE